MKNVIITGATGMIGGIVLQHCLQSADIKLVTSIVRKPSGLKHPKLTEIVHKDFSDYTAIEDCFKNMDVAYYCLGVYTGVVADALFKEITVDYTVAFADTLHRHSPKAVFCFLSGAGADRTEKSKMSFARYKGMAENHLMGLGLGGVYVFRPSYIYPVESRNEPNFTYRLSRTLYPLIKLLGSNMSIQSTELGRALFMAGINAPKKDTLENRDILEYLGTVGGK